MGSVVDGDGSKWVRAVNGTCLECGHAVCDGSKGVLHGPYAIPQIGKLMAFQACLECDDGATCMVPRMGVAFGDDVPRVEP